MRFKTMKKQKQNKCKQEEDVMCVYIRSKRISRQYRHFKIIPESLVIPGTQVGNSRTPLYNQLICKNVLTMIYKNFPHHICCLK